MNFGHLAGGLKWTESIAKIWVEILSHPASTHGRAQTPFTKAFFACLEGFVHVRVGRVRVEVLNMGQN